MIKIINTTDPEYRDILELRNNVLRKPLGMEISNDDLSDEAECLHLSFYTKEVDIAGCLKIKQLDSHTYQILQMAVPPAYQGQGIGRKLLMEAEMLISNQGGTEVVIEARDYAIPFYMKNRYQKIGDMYLKINIPHQKMTKSL